MFSKAGTDFLQKYGFQFINFNNANYTNKVFKYSGKHWILKVTLDNNLRTKEIMTSLVGSDVVNVAEVKILTQEDLKKIEVPLSEAEQNSSTPFMVRVAQDYSIEELPLKSLEAAVAGELVFSVWTRRRDTHEFNRGYTNYIPVFFDHGVSFEGEKNIDVFFSRTGKGFAGSWRVKVINSPEEIDKIFRKDNWGDNHYICNEKNFLLDVQRMVEIIKSRSDSIERMIIPSEVSIDDQNKIKNILVENASSLGYDVNKMLNVVFS